MTTQAVATQGSKPSLLAKMASMYEMEPAAFAATVKSTVFPGGTATNEQLAAFLMVCDAYHLNPILKQIYAFPAKGGGVVPMLSVDGWAKLVNDHEASNGFKFRYERDEDGAVYAITCMMWRKDRMHAAEVTEFLDECKGTSPSWAKSPMRMLRHRAFIQCARLAYNLSGLYGEDEAQEIAESDVVTLDSRPAGLQGITAQLKAKKAERGDLGMSEVKRGAASEALPDADDDPDADLFRDMSGSKVDPG